MRGFVFALLLMQLAAAATVSAAKIPLGRRCERMCGGVDVPYPFGTSYGCHRRGFRVTCDRTYQPPKLFLQSNGPEVLEMSVRNSTVRVRGAVWLFAAGNASAEEEVEAPIPTGLVSFHVRLSWLDRNSTAAAAQAQPPPLWVAPGARILAVEEDWWSDRQNVAAVKTSLFASGRTDGLVIPAILDWALCCAQNRSARQRDDRRSFVLKNECFPSKAPKKFVFFVEEPTVFQRKTAKI
uniref:Wall-associated receptor kinase galacturonan-binding domain-containing protein n=1 Tax=Oryza brachyantha TaxID=4533 RepID=J3MS00_ORYBR